MRDRDLAIVLSGGGMNGLLMELGFLRRLRADPLWVRIGWVYGTSAGALSGVMAVLDRLDELEQFVLELQPDETFRPNRLWQFPSRASTTTRSRTRSWSASRPSRTSPVRRRRRRSSSSSA
ncbi:MAG TPA: patatin-like phospholipase family protein [Gaiella sp.]|nr:patatin-like phospholipase family protein [Gaiella sp.]